MPETTQHRKRYESNKTVAQIWTGRAIMLGVIVLVGLLLFRVGFNVYLLFAKPDKDGPLIWATDDGIAYSEKGGERTGVFKLPAGNGETTSNPRFNVVGGKLVYYSPESKSICVVGPGDGPKWVNLESVLPPEGTVREVRPIGDNGVIVVAYNKSDDPDNMGSPAGAARYIFGANDAQPLDGSIAAYSPDGKSTLSRSASGAFAGISNLPKTMVDWDYDFKSQTMFVSEGKSISAIHGSAKDEFGLGMLYFIRHVQAHGSEVWIDVVKPFRAGHLLLAYDSAGNFKSLKLKDKSDIKPPYVSVTPELLAVLTKIAGSVQD